MIEPAITRLGDRVAALRGRIRGAAEFSALMQSNSFRDASGGAYVLPVSLRGGQPRAATGAFVQPVDEVIAVVVIVPSSDPRGVRALGAIDTLVDAVIAALAGWAPPGAMGPLRLVQGRMINVGAGVLVYQIDLATTNHLRINPT